jgi:hypothetical protein
VVGIAGAALLARLPFLGWPMGSDEGGLLLIASQWRPGSSLYGDYWVDRPPLLIDVFVLAQHLGGLPALRVLGIVLVLVSVLLAARVARLAGGSGPAGALTAAVFLVNPLFGVHEVNGELVAVPLVLTATASALAASRAPAQRTTTLLLCSGSAAAAAVLVKQNEIDGIVLLLVGACTFLARGPRTAWRALAVACVGALATTTLVVVHAAWHGTDPLSLWDAVVTFRLDAAHLISTSAPHAVTGRLLGVLLALGASGAPLVLLALARQLHRRPRHEALDLRWASVALLVWETFSVVGGGSYWLHYLICLVPGLVLATAVITARGPSGRHALVVPLTLSAASAAVAIMVFLAQPGLTRTDPVITWLREHRTPGQTGLVAFGHPDYLTATGLTSPYPELWSLPVRVRDPQLRHLTAVLASSDRPDWVVTNAAGTLGGWGIDPSTAQRVLDAHYRLVADLGSRRIFLNLDDTTSSPQVSTSTGQEAP